MSSLPRISFVVEGITDFIVLDALVDRFLGGIDYVPTQIQPQNSEFLNGLGPLGGGWKGVLKWCDNISNSTDGFIESIVIANCEYLVIHVDSDIALEPELASLGLSQPCPPARNACDGIRAHLVSLLGGALPTTVLICVPAQCTEAWIFAAMHPVEVAKFEPFECRAEPDRLLIGKSSRLVRGKDGAAKKQPVQYRAFAARIAAGWQNAVDLCPEAARFDSEARAAFKVT